MGVDRLTGPQMNTEEQLKFLIAKQFVDNIRLSSEIKALRSVLEATYTALGLKIGAAPIGETISKMVEMNIEMGIAVAKAKLPMQADLIQEIMDDACGTKSN
jgi:hypothetical protein